ncbi:MAG: TIGR02391 family protein, partial [Candidatus Heimdallarchaeaceae archaeon]
MGRVKYGLVRDIAEQLNRHPNTIRSKIIEKRESLANLYSMTVSAYAYAHEQGLDFSEQMTEVELSQVKEILGTGFKLVISDRADIPKSTNKVIKEQIQPSLKDLLDEVKNKGNDELALVLFDTVITHPRILKVSRSHWHNKQYRSAVLDAQIELENMVKEKANYPSDNNGVELSGVGLMHKVFDSKNPILKWSSLSYRVQKD